MSSDLRPPPSDGLSGRSLAILLGFLAAFLLVLGFGYYRRNAHLRALREAGDTPGMDIIARRRRLGPRPVLAEVDVAKRAKQPTWTAIQPLSARLFEPSTARNRQPRSPVRRYPAQRDLESVMAAAWFGGMQVNGAVPPLPSTTTPYPPPPLPRPPPSPRVPPNPELQVAVLIAMPRPPSPPSPIPGPSVLRSGETHDHPPDTRQEVTLGLAVMPWRHSAQERSVPAMWSADRAADMLA
ncbi:hypothetical protein PENSPDRAFT_689364 [Peniophora sp. CONT]|nr:hypothetical protein PENSPDRAFT_689364 [Peniophora sp. CONT]